MCDPECGRPDLLVRAAKVSGHPTQLTETTLSSDNNGPRDRCGRNGGALEPYWNRTGAVGHYDYGTTHQCDGKNSLHRLDMYLRF
jgi:hypothetical protein